MGADEDVAEAEAAARRALGVCLYAKGCGAHQRCDSVAEAQAWCADHRAANPGHRVDVWQARVDDLAVAVPILRAIYSAQVDAKRRAAAERDAIINDPDHGKTWVSPVFYDAVRERAESSPEMKLVLNKIRPMTPMEALPDDRLAPRNQPIPIGRNRRGKRRKSQR